MALGVVIHVIRRPATVRAGPVGTFTGTTVVTVKPTRPASHLQILDLLGLSRSHNSSYLMPSAADKAASPLQATGGSFSHSTSTPTTVYGSRLPDPHVQDPTTGSG